MEDLALQAFAALLQSGPWGMAFAATLYFGGRALTTASEHLCELFPKVLSIADKLVDKGLELRLKTYHYTPIEEDDDTEET